MKKYPQALGQLLHQQTSELPNLIEKAELLRQLNQQLKFYLAPSVASEVQVANFRNNILVLETRSAAWAARLKFQQSALLHQLQTEVLPMLTSIEVKVNPALNKNAISAKVCGPKLSLSAAAHLEALAEQTDGALRLKLKRLASKASR